MMDFDEDKIELKKHKEQLERDYQEAINELNNKHKEQLEQFERDSWLHYEYFKDLVRSKEFQNYHEKIYIDAIKPLLKQARNGLSLTFQRGSLAILEAVAIIILVRSIAISWIDLDIMGIGLGAIILICGLAFEYLFWKKSIEIIKPRMDNLETENAFLKSERERLLNLMLSGALSGAFSGENSELKSKKSI